MDSQEQIRTIQRALQVAGLIIGPVDGDAGPRTMTALHDVLALWQEHHSAPTDESKGKEFPSVSVYVPQDWMPDSKAKRIIVHWTAGNSKASKDDATHYHFLINDDGELVRGTKTVADNDSITDGVYAAHTLDCNTNSIGVSLAGMAGAIESPFSAGTHPITRKQWEVLPEVLAQLCDRYGIAVSPKTVLSHAEVEETLGIHQKGKWDIARLPFDDSVKGARDVGDQFRAATAKLLSQV